MLPSLGFGEMLLIVVVAIIVVGPKDLPVMMRKVGQFMRRIRELGNEFKAAFDDIGRETELDDLRKEIADLKTMGNIGEVSDKAFEDEMRRLDADIRADVKGEHPRVETPKPAPKPTPAIDTPKPKAAAKLKSAPKPKVKTTPKAKTSPSAPKAKAKAKPKPKTTAAKASKAKASKGKA